MKLKCLLKLGSALVLPMVLFSCAQSQPPMAQIPFASVFKNNMDGSITPIQPFTIKGSGITIGAGGTVRKGTMINGVDVLSLKDKTLLVDQKQQDGAIVIVKAVSP